jgi:hypothetical protein
MLLNSFWMILQPLLVSHQQPREGQITQLIDGSSS